VKRRAFLASPLLILPGGANAAVDYPDVRSGQKLVFPRDHGSHPAYRTEWWYLTGRLRSAQGEELGVQITFFRSRTGIGEDNPSHFAPRQLLFAHAALSDPRVGHLLHDQRAGREGFGLAYAREGETDVTVGDWSLRRAGDAYEARIAAREFEYVLRFRTPQALLLQGDSGYSRKGRDPRHASYYYSRPQLAVSGSMKLGAGRFDVTGTAWLDHEWSSEGMAAGAVGWDWAGLNLADGGALMAFRMRDPGGGTLWAGGSHRDAAGRVTTFGPEDVAFTAQRRWRSPRTQVEYPVSVRVRAGAHEYVLEPLMDDQELDSRASTGTIYWEGAVNARAAGAIAGQGYLELTGYWKPLKL
jgi:predicted secreted hydrolase